MVAPVITEWPENFLWQLNQPAEDPAEFVIPQRLFIDAIYVASGERPNHGNPDSGARHDKIARPGKEPAE